MRPTPETDAQMNWTDASGWFVSAHFARNLERQRDEAREQARYGWERHAEKDAAYGKALAQRDRLLEALEESLALNINWADSTEPHNLEYFSEYRAVIAQARKAIAEVKGAK